MISLSTIQKMGLPIGITASGEDPLPPDIYYLELNVESCLDWLKANTSLEFDVDDEESLCQLPGSVKLFICKYHELFSRDTHITSESIGGMSQSFDTTSRYDLLWQLANELIGDYLTGGIKVFVAKRKWC